jgi:predicted  nucleic acid-binding Zn-ribbon protein
MSKDENKNVSGPLFVDIEAFRTMLSDIDTIKNDIKSSESALQHLDELKNSKDREMERWRGQLENIQSKINYVDKVLFKEA